jgi:hypothetical protein
MYWNIKLFSSPEIVTRSILNKHNKPLELYIKLTKFFHKRPTINLFFSVALYISGFNNGSSRLAHHWRYLWTRRRSRRARYRPR